MKKVTKILSGIAIAARLRHGGPMRDKRSKRAEENKHPDFISDELEHPVLESDSNLEEINLQLENSLLNPKDEEE